MNLRRVKVEPETPRCARCHMDGGFPRYIEGQGTRFLHSPCEARLAAMGFVIRPERLVVRRVEDRAS